MAYSGDVVNDHANLHAEGTVLRTGAAPAEAKGAVILLHGRGATASGIIGLSEALGRADLAYLAPQAALNTWYPYRFMETRERNEPYLSSALDRVASLLAELEGAGLPAEKVVVAGFSQGACLALDFVARHPRRYGGAAGLSGGLIGAAIKPEDYTGDLAGTPVFLGCSDVDGHIPLERVQLSSRILSGLGGAVTERIYPGMGHAVNEDEIVHLRAILDGIAAG